MGSITPVSGLDQPTSGFDKIRQRRAASGRLVAGIAAVSNSDMFKEPTEGLPLAQDFSNYFSPESLSRQVCVLKKAAGYLKKEGIISLGGGLPSSEYFPFSEVSLRVPMPPDFSEKSMKTVTIGKHDARDGVSEYDLSIALNYNQATGSAQMMRFITEHVELVFKPPYADWQVCQTIGSTGALEQAIRLLCDRGRGDAVVTEEYTYASALQAIQPQGIRVFGVKMDDEGMIPEELEDLLSSWDAEARGCRRPHVLYTVPSGQNPTGATQSLARRRSLYAVCRRYNIYVLEDEPYYFLQMEPYVGGGGSSNGTGPDTSKSLESFLGSLVPSYLSLDTDGRVMRMDSFSKILTPGARIGWITASRQVIQGFLRHAEVSNQGPGGVSQILLWKLLDETWGHEGYVAWLRNLRSSYTARRNTLLKACDEVLPREVVTWTPPAAGMFLWLKVDHTKHPDYPQKSILDLEEEIFLGAIDDGVLCARGSWFRAEPDTAPTELFFRTTYAAASEEAMTVAVGRLAAAIRRSFKLSG